MRRHAIRIAFAIIAIAAAAAIAIGDVVHRSAAGRRLREAILAELQPVVLKNCTLQRFGSANDGGYLMCENLIEPLDGAYRTRTVLAGTTIGDASCRAGITSGYISMIVLILPGQPATVGTFVFHNECVGDRTGDRGSRFFRHAGKSIRKNADTGRRLIIKMDIEGAEWDSLLAVPDDGTGVDSPDCDGDARLR